MERERERESSQNQEFNWQEYSELECQRAFWSFYEKNVYEDSTHKILDQAYYEKYIINGTDGINEGVLYEFKKKFDQFQTLEKALGEALSYLKNFNNNGLIQIPRWICIATFTDHKYWLIDAKNYENFIYENNTLNIAPSSAKPVVLKENEQSLEWLDPKDLVLKITPTKNDEKYLLTKLNINNFHNINDKFYEKLELENDSTFVQTPDVFIKDLFKGMKDIEKCVENSGLNLQNDFNKIKKLKSALMQLNQEKKILYWVEPIFINDLKEIIAEKWDHVGGKDYRKDRGAFFTPKEYAEIMQTYLKNIFNENPDKEILVIDRCAGTGQLEYNLPKDILKCFVLNTYEFCEWVNLGSKFQNKVRMLKPPYTNAQLIDVYIDENLMENGNALTEEFNSWLKKYIDNWRSQFPNGKIVFFENPPFRDETANSHGNGHSITKSYIYNKLKEETKIADGTIRDLSFQFIWSANQFLNAGDEYCLISPIKYWKWRDINSFNFIEGFLSNRKKYNATEGGIPIIRWKKNFPNSYGCSSIFLSNELDDKKIEIKQINKRVNEFNIPIVKKDASYAILSVGNMFVHNGNILTNLNKGISNKKFYVSNENILQISVLNALNAWKGKDYIRDALTIMKSADKQDSAWKDIEFLNDCLLWTLLTDKTECFSYWSDSNELILNEICYAGKAIEKLDKNLLDNDHKELIKIWNQLNKKIVENCKSKILPKFNYGLKQIMNDFNTKKVWTTRFGKKQEDYEFPEINSSIKTLKTKLSDFYDKYIYPKLEKYELLK